MSVKDADLDMAGTRDPKKDFNDLLEFAGELQDRCDQSSQRLLSYRTAASGLVIGAVTIGVAIGSFADLGRFSALSATSAAVLGIMYGASIELVLARKVATRLRRDRRALSEVLDLLRAVESSLAELEQLTPLGRAKLRVQLSRFDI